jgi:hypothetical protein
MFLKKQAKMLCSPALEQVNDVIDQICDALRRLYAVNGLAGKLLGTLEIEWSHEPTNNYVLNRSPVEPHR